MREAWISVITNFKSFIGSGWLMWACFCVALLICFFLRKDQRKKLCTVSIILCVIIINPVVYKLFGERFLSGVYWRLFWTLPIVILIAAVLTELSGKISKNVLRFLTVGVLCIAIALTGKSVINRGTYTVPDNDYQIPQAAIDVSDLVLSDTDHMPVLILAPDDLVCYIRQYSAKIRLAYGRDIWGFISDPKDWERDLYERVHAEQVDYEALGTAAYGYGCSYIVFDTQKNELPKGISKMGYTYVGSTEQYVVYALEESK